VIADFPTLARILSRASIVLAPRSKDMQTLKGKTAVVVGASSGVGRATLVALAAQGTRVCGVARGRERLDRIVRETPGEVMAVAADATEPEVAARLLREHDPDLLVLALGVQPQVEQIDAYTWESFCAPWHTDVKAAFHFCQEAVRKPLRPGSTVVIVSSGAAINGSPLSGGYAGAKRMQWLLAGYMQRLSDKRGLGIRFVALLPKQLIVGTAIADAASRGYGEETGLGQAGFMARFGAQLMPEGVAAAILAIARRDAGTEAPSFAVTGAGIEALA
jgi:NAD(P)-dependent dehydrogenase (short-subunit alcohol dehydrogenase family)